MEGAGSAETSGGSPAGRTGHGRARSGGPIQLARTGRPRSDMPLAAGQWRQRAGLKMVPRLMDQQTPLNLHTGIPSMAGDVGGEGYDYRTSPPQSAGWHSPRHH